jgi:hypothetical protein
MSLTDILHIALMLGSIYLVTEKMEAEKPPPEPPEFIHPYTDTYDGSEKGWKIDKKYTEK